MSLSWHFRGGFGLSRMWLTNWTCVPSWVIYIGSSSRFAALNEQKSMLDQKLKVPVRVNGTFDSMHLLHVYHYA